MSDLRSSPMLSVVTAAANGMGAPDPLTGMAPDASTERNTDAAEVPEGIKRFVKRLQKEIKASKKKWDPDYKRIREDRKFLKGIQWSGQKNVEDEDRYVANIVKREMKNRVASLYAKNPTIVAEPRKKLEFAIWNGDPAVIMQAQQAAAPYAQVGLEPPPQITQLLADVQQGFQKKQLMENVGRTLEIVFAYQMDEQEPDFVGSMKRVVRRARTTGVGYVGLGYHRAMQEKPEKDPGIPDDQDLLENVQSKVNDLSDGEIEKDSADEQELEEAKASLQEEPDVVLREGLKFWFPDPLAVIPDFRCKQLVGFLGCKWVAEEFVMSTGKVKEVFKVDLGSNGCKYTAYDSTGKERGTPTVTTGATDSDKPESYSVVWRIYYKPTRRVYYVADGYEQFLIDPHRPSIDLERFFPIYALTFNEVDEDENEGSVFPISDVRDLFGPQRELNRSREAYRQHRFAAQPKYAAAAGVFEKEDLENLSKSEAHDIIRLRGMDKGEKVGDLLQPLAFTQIDPRMYEVDSIYQDVYRISGNQVANLGDTSGATATEVATANGTQMSSRDDDTDELDRFLTQIARDGGKVLLREMSVEYVQEIAGAGAVWPQLNREEIAKEIDLKVEAGSTGRPNKSQDIANLERLTPLLTQIPGITPFWLASRTIKLLDDKTDIADAYMEGQPSMTSLNGASQPSTGNPATDPNAQGPQGGNNQPGASQPRPGAQPGQPAPAGGTTAPVQAGQGG